MKNQNQKKERPLADTKRALYEMMAQDGLRFPETVDDIDRIEANVDETRIPTPDVNKFLRFLRNEEPAAGPTGCPVVRFPINAPPTPTNLGHFLILMRRKRGYTVERLAKVADLDVGELRVIESDPNYEPELCTVHGIAKYFGFPVTSLMKVAQLASGRQSFSPEYQLRYAASSNISAPLTTDEEAILQAYLSAVIDQSRHK